MKSLFIPIKLILFGCNATMPTLFPSFVILLYSFSIIAISSFFDSAFMSSINSERCPLNDLTSHTMQNQVNTVVAERYWLIFWWKERMQCAIVHYRRAQTTFKMVLTDLFEISTISKHSSSQSTILQRQVFDFVDVQLMSTCFCSFW